MYNAFLLLFLFAIFQSTRVYFLPSSTSTTERTVLVAQPAPTKRASNARRPPTEECYVRTDYGIVDRIRKSAKTFCSPEDFVSSPGNFQSSYTFYRYDRGSMQATTFRGLRLDMSKAEIVQDIVSIAEENSVKHNPRYKFASVRPLCQCERDSLPQDSDNGAPRVWLELLCDDKIWRAENFTSQNSTDSGKIHRVCEAPKSSDVPALTINESVHVLAVARFLDHNPFFQISQTLNTWIMIKVLGWTSLDTQIVYLDKGIASPVDELRHKMLAPTRPALRIEELLGEQSGRAPQTKIVEFGNVLITPYEWTGPLMRHLDSYEPCARSQLIADFRSTALAAMEVEDQKVNASSCKLTVISRRDYGGRNLERVWRNEQEVVDRMQTDFGDACVVEVVDFSEVPIAEQMRKIVDSDIIIGMHGAGMTNVVWARRGVLVIEIFPKLRRRWGYRNICQQLGIEWHDFRGGEDIVNPLVTKYVDGFPNPNKLDKIIPPDEWAAFATPLLRSAIDRVLHADD